jgi:hypothetical protein
MSAPLYVCNSIQAGHIKIASTVINKTAKNRRMATGVIPRSAWREEMGDVDFVNGLRRDDNRLNARQ